MSVGVLGTRCLKTFGFKFPFVCFGTRNRSNGTFGFCGLIIYLTTIRAVKIIASFLYAA